MAVFITPAWCTAGHVIVGEVAAAAAAAAAKEMRQDESDDRASR